MEKLQTASTTHSESAPLRGVTLPPLQTTFAQKPFQKLQRPRPPQATTVEKNTQSSQPLEKSALGRRASKGGLLGLFGRNKSYKASKSQATTEALGEGGEEKQGIKGLFGASQSRVGAVKAAPAVEEQCFARDINIVPSGQAKFPTSDRQGQAPGKSNHTSRSKSFKKESTTWDPPPLFQAYPQAIKHSSLSTPPISADAILRYHGSGKGLVADSSQSMPTENADVTDCDHPESGKRGRAVKKRQRSHETVLNGQWVQKKIYVLVTSGYILQYAGEGSFDRLPEKILALRKDSAAFASDAIPGKPWVLRVCQETSGEDDACVSQGAKPVFRRFAFRNEARRCVSNFLLVIDNPEEMGEWLVAVRKEIEALGGKKYRPDVTVRRTSSERRRLLRERPSRRFLIKRDPNQFADRPWDQAASPSDTVPPEPPSEEPGRRVSVAARKSIDSPSVCNTTVSTEQCNLDRLRETPRMSYASNAKTMSTSPASSPGHSPVHARPRSEEKVSKEARPEYFMAPKSQRLCTHLVSSPPMTQRKSSENSTSRPASNSSRAGSSELSSPPHFSVPSYSKRYSVANNRVSRLGTPPSGRSSTIRETDIASAEAFEDHSNPHRTSVLGELQPISSRTSPKGSKSLGNLSAHFNPPPPIISFVPESSAGELISSKVDAAVPRRFSSLAYSRGISPIRDTSSDHLSPSPHPPPTSALPAIPGASSSLLPPGPHRHSIQALAGKQERNLRRPTSMQVRTRQTVRIDEDIFEIVSKRPCQAEDSIISSDLSVTANSKPSECHISEATASPPPTRSAPPPPSPPPLETTDNLSPINQVPREKSSQLPRLPSIRVSQKGFRGSLEGPWSSGYKNERGQGVKAN